MAWWSWFLRAIIYYDRDDGLPYVSPNQMLCPHSIAPSAIYIGCLLYLLWLNKDFGKIKLISSKANTQKNVFTKSNLISALWDENWEPPLPLLYETRSSRDESTVMELAVLLFTALGGLCIFEDVNLGKWLVTTFLTKDYIGWRNTSRKAQNKGLVQLILV